MEKKIVCIVGNGFNFLAADIIQNDNSKRDRNRFNNNKTKDTANHIRGLAQLWELFDCFDSIRKYHTSLNMNDEELIGLIYNLSDFFENDILNTELRKRIQLNEHLETFLIEKIKSVNKLFQSYENSGCYRVIKNMFYDFGNDFKKYLKANKVERLNMYTTNFDGIIDTVLSHERYYPDGFGKRTLNPTMLGLDNSKLSKQPFTLVHLHGSYKFCRENGTTYKMVKLQENLFPVMVFNNPHLKLQRIMEDSVLSQYWTNLVNDLRSCDRLIILGNSLRTEPHIKGIIKDNFNRINTELVICDLNPELVEQELNGFYSNDIYKFTTKRLDTEFSFADLVNQLFCDELDKCGRNINNFKIAA